MFRTPAELCIQHQGGSTSLLQRRLRIGYGRAARASWTSWSRPASWAPPDRSNPRDVLVDFADVERIAGD